VNAPTLTVPANCSRFFGSREQATKEPTAQIRVAWDSAGGFAHNELFDESLIRHDGHYYTTVVNMDAVVQVPTLDYFGQVLEHLPPSPTVVDIGCGQGEFVDGVRSRYGVEAVGYDPVLRTESDHLFARYWDESAIEGDVHVLRCVLPHIPDPWAFLARLGRAGRHSLALIEFQQLEWIIEHAIWFQISHDHVNLFSVQDFRARYDVVDTGTFRNEEWGWVLLDPASDRDPAARGFELASGLTSLLQERERFLSYAAAQDAPLAVWGAAGKGIVLAHAMTDAGVQDLVAIDADPRRAGQHMEVSGVEILSPAAARERLPGETVVLVSNPNHLPDVERWVDGQWRVTLPSRFG
jgi:hypothetical protein